ncbi:MAG: hypothetical protein WCG99_04240 [Candidatus Berkelbacteria bacterium]
MPGRRDTRLYRAARARGDAIRGGAPCDITPEERRGLYVDCTGLGGGHGHQAVHISHPRHHSPVPKSGKTGDPTLGDPSLGRRPPLLGG